MDNNSIINNNDSYNENELNSKINDLDTEIYMLDLKAGGFAILKKINMADFFLLLLGGSTAFLFNIYELLIINIIVLTATKVIGFSSYNYFNKKINVKVSEITELINRKKELEELKRLKKDKKRKKVNKSLLKKIDDLDKDELLAVRTVVTEYTTNKDIPSQVGNIAQFLTETQVCDIDIKDTSLYNKQVDEKANSKGKAKIYYINRQKLD